MARLKDKNRSPLFNQIASLILILAGVFGVFYTLVKLIPTAGFIGVIGLIISLVIIIVGLDEGASEVKRKTPPGSRGR